MLHWLNTDKFRKNPMDSCYDDGSELSFFTQIWNFLFKLSGYQLIKDICLAYSLSITQGVMV
jgi:hypothetical protein